MRKNQLTSTDLNIGDIVYCDGYIAEVTALDNIHAHLRNSNKASTDAFYKHIKPIPLRLNMILKAGWEKTMENDEARIKVNAIEYIYLKQDKVLTNCNHTPTFSCYFKSGFGVDICTLKYLHEFQHLIKVFNLPKQVKLDMLINNLKEDKEIC